MPAYTSSTLIQSAPVSKSSAAQNRKGSVNFEEGILGRHSLSSRPLCVSIAMLVLIMLVVTAFSFYKLTKETMPWN